MKYIQSFFSVFMVVLSLFLFPACEPGNPEDTHSASLPGEPVTMDKDVLKDKIKGGWAGQVIGCTYGGPTEFRYPGTMIQDYVPIAWDDNRIKWYYDNAPGLYDDIYMDLTFVEVFEKEGLDAPADSHARAFANAGYVLWHANQAARYNILNGIMPPASGYWENNPHAEDIDFQIEADFAGLMSPGMINTSGEICDKIGHIMNYGDGWYGGVYMAAMYTQAFVSGDIEYIVKEALKAIPPESDFYRCVSDVIRWHEKYPDDWKKTWCEVEKKWSSDVGCPDGVFKPFDIDAKINAAYVVIGLLYGQGDYGKTLEIATRCGQDSDCNPASAGGILGTVLGYSNIPAYWKQGLDKMEDVDFKYTTMSLNDVYRIGFKHALENIEKHGGKIEQDQVVLKPQKPVPVKYEKGFQECSPKEILSIVENRKKLGLTNKEYSFEFTGTGFVLRGSARPRTGAEKNHVFEIEMTIDGEHYRKILLPTDYHDRRTEICWKYNLPEKDHHVTIRLMNSQKGYFISMNEILVYNKPGEND